MPKAATKPDPREAAKLRHGWARALLSRQKKIAADLLKIDEAKEALRGLCETSGEGFTEEVAGLGSVEVKAGSEAKFKGTMPELVAENFLELPEKQRDKLIEDGIVVLAQTWSKASKPSVTVRM